DRTRRRSASNESAMRSFPETGLPRRIRHAPDRLSPRASPKSDECGFRDALAGGEAGIRTLDTAFRPYNGLANRPLQPLGHLTARGILSIREASSCGNPAVPKMSLKIVPAGRRAATNCRPIEPTDS